jgi:DNA-binding PadR family transcriptional regulator
MALREVILTVLAHRRMTGYEISRNFDQVLSWFWTASHQQIYRELARLNEDGSVRFKEVRQSGKPDKKVYEITKAGRAELKRWLGEPTPPPRPQYDLLVKMLAGASLGTSLLAPEIERHRAVTNAILEQIHQMEAACALRPPTTAYDRTMHLALRRGHLMVDAQIAWLAEVEQYLKTSSV